MIATSVADSDHMQHARGGSASPHAAPPRLARDRAARGRVLRPSAVPVVASDLPFEREADRIANAVIGTTEPPGTTPGGGGEMPAPRIVRDVLRKGGVPLDQGSREFFEPRFRHDLSAVRVHTGGAAAASARSIQAQAYTAGN